MGKRRAKPKDPEVARRERLEREGQARADTKTAERGMEWGIAADTALPANADVQLTPAKKGGKDAAERMDAFNALRAGMPPGAYDAARRLERDMLQRAGLGFCPPGSYIVVDNASMKPKQVLMWEAGDRVKAALASIGDRDGWLLSELILPSPETTLRCTSWREVVAYITGETEAHGQGAAVRAACANLAAAYERRMAA